MATTVNRAGFWDDTVWGSIDDGVMKAAMAINVVQKVFPTVQADKKNYVPADIFNPERMSIEEGHTRPFIELVIEFPLTNGQVNDEPSGATAITLSKLAAKSLALGADMVILQGKNAELPSSVRIESGEDSVGYGLLGLAHERKITVNPPDPGAPTNSGGEILAAIAKGIALLTKDLQSPEYALIEDTNAFAVTWGSVINGAPAYNVLNPVLTKGIYGTGAMPPITGLLIALGGDPTTIYIGDDPTTEPTLKEKAGRYFFRTFERVQYVARDHRAFVILDFSYLASSEPARRSQVAVRSDSKS